MSEAQRPNTRKDEGKRCAWPISNSLSRVMGKQPCEQIVRYELEGKHYCAKHIVYAKAKAYDELKHAQATAVSERPRRKSDRRLRPDDVDRRQLKDRRTVESKEGDPMRRMVKRRGVWPYGNRGRRASDPAPSDLPDGQQSPAERDKP